MRPSSARWATAGWTRASDSRSSRTMAKSSGSGSSANAASGGGVDAGAGETGGRVDAGRASRTIVSSSGDARLAGVLRLSKRRQRAHLIGEAGEEAQHLLLGGEVAHQPGVAADLQALRSPAARRARGPRPPDAATGRSPSRRSGTPARSRSGRSAPSPPPPRPRGRSGSSRPADSSVPYLPEFCTTTLPGAWIDELAVRVHLDAGAPGDDQVGAALVAGGSAHGFPAFLTSRRGPAAARIPSSGGRSGPCARRRSSLGQRWSRI